MPDPKRPRFTKRLPRLGPAMTMDGIDLGHAMVPQEILIWLRQILRLSDVQIADAMHRGAAEVEATTEATGDYRPILDELPTLQRKAAIAIARNITPSRAAAWRRRSRHMTWDEMRVLLVGLRELVEELED